MMSPPEFDRVGFHLDLQVDDETVFEVLIAAGHLQVTSVVQQCCDYSQTQFVQLRFDVQTYCRVSAIADRHGLKDLQEATQTKMAYIYKEICESEDFLSHVDADQYTRLLSRNDLSAPSETFVFKSVMLRIQYNTIQILLSTPHGGFSETNINSTGNHKKKKERKKKYSRIVNKQLLRNYMHIEFMTSQIDYNKLLRNYLHINL